MPMRTAPQRPVERVKRERLTVRVKVQYAPTEAALLKHAIAPKKLATYLRDLSLRSLARPVLVPSRTSPNAKLAAELAVITYQLRKIGNNLNQLAKQANAGMVAVTRDEMDAALASVDDAVTHIKRLTNETLG